MNTRTLIFGCGVLLMLLAGCSNKAVDDYNAYADSIRKHVLRGDKVLTEIGGARSSDAKLQRGVDGWLKTIRDGRIELETLTPSDPELAQLHGPLLKRQLAIEDAIIALKEGLRSPDKAAFFVAKMKAKFKSSTGYRDDWKEAQEAFAKNHNMTIKALGE